MKARQIERRLDQLPLPQKRILMQKLKALCFRGRAGAEREDAGDRVIGAYALACLMADDDAHCGQHILGMGGQIARGFLRETLGGAVNRIDVIVAIMKEITHLFPRGRRGKAILAQGLVQRGQPLMGLAISPVQIEKGARQGGCVGGGKPEIGQRRCAIGENRISQRLAHVGNKPLGIACAQFGDIDAKFLRQPQNHGGGDRAVIVLHLVEIGQRDRELGREILLRQRKARTNFAQLGTGIKLGWGHAASGKVCNPICTVCKTLRKP